MSDTMDDFRNRIDSIVVKYWRSQKVEHTATAQFEEICHVLDDALAAALHKLRDELPEASVITTKYGYTSKEKKYGYRIAMTEAVALIDAALLAVGEGKL